MKDYLITGAIVIVALILYFGFIQSRLKISAYEADYERI